MSLHRWNVDSCEATIAEGDDWATVYYIESKVEGKGHATKLFKQAKKYYEKRGKKFGCSVDLNPAIRHICGKLDIPVYDDAYIEANNITNYGS